MRIRRLIELWDDNRLIWQAQTYRHTHTVGINGMTNDKMRISKMDIWRWNVSGNNKIIASPQMHECDFSFFFLFLGLVRSLGTIGKLNIEHCRMVDASTFRERCMWEQNIILDLVCRRLILVATHNVTIFRIPGTYHIYANVAGWWLVMMIQLLVSV